MTGRILSVIIPTYGRDRVLLDTCESLFKLSPAPLEILLVDQTENHDESTRTALERWHQDGTIRWIRMSPPSIARAMNRGLLEARGDIVLFLDDDIVPDEGLFQAHISAHAEGRGEVVAGRVFQPWDKDRVRKAGTDSEDIDFTADGSRQIDQFMGGNVSMRRDRALAVGGVDENFVQVAYRFEREWADRFIASGDRIWYESGAKIEHLKAGSGGTRSYRSRRLNPGHGVGEYYYLLRSPRIGNRLGGFARRLYRASANRYHVRRPWMLPGTWVVELAAMAWAGWMCVRGARLIDVKTSSAHQDEG